MSRAPGSTSPRGDARSRRRGRAQRGDHRSTAAARGSALFTPEGLRSASPGPSLLLLLDWAGGPATTLDPRLGSVAAGKQEVSAPGPPRFSSSEPGAPPLALYPGPGGVKPSESSEPSLSMQSPALAAVSSKRRTGLEPATSSLGSWRSTS